MKWVNKPGISLSMTPFVHASLAAIMASVGDGANLDVVVRMNSWARNYVGATYRMERAEMTCTRFGSA